MVYTSNTFITGSSSTKRKAGALWLLLYLSTLSGAGWAQANLYRYIDKDGVKVISHTIPPEYSQNGYEIITHTGKVLEVVPPAPDPVELKEQEAKRAQERELMAEYEVLARRYSSAEEIYAARDRRLARLDASIAILRSNIGNINNQHEHLMKKAAEIERSGRDVPLQMLQNLEEVRAERRTTEEMLRNRLVEHESIQQEYEKQVLLFKRGKELENSKRMTDKR